MSSSRYLAVEALAKSLHPRARMQKPAYDQTRVVLIEAHMLVREALQKVMAAASPQAYLCASLSKVREAFALLDQEEIDVIIIGSSITISDCLDFLKLLAQKGNPPGIIVVQQALRAETALTVIKSGVKGLLGEDASGEDLVRAIETVAAGNTFLGRRAREILDVLVSRAPVHLTVREVEVLARLKCGESNFRIAHALGLKEKTVEKHLSHIYTKLNVSSRIEAILYTQFLHI